MKILKNLAILLLLALGVLSSASAEIFRYTDTAGQVHYVQSEDKVPEQYRSQIKDAPPLPDLSRGAGGKYSNRPLTTAYSADNKIEIFVTSWCPYCRALERFLVDKQVKFTKYDIEKNAAGKRIYDALGVSGVPVIRIGSKVIRGFDAESLGRSLGSSSISQTS